MMTLDPAGLEAAAKALCPVVWDSRDAQLVRIYTAQATDAVRAYLAASPVPPDGKTLSREFDEDGRALCFQCGEPQSAHPDGEECEGREYARGFAAGRASATPDPTHPTMWRGDPPAATPDPPCLDCGGADCAEPCGEPAPASPDERLREALRDANEYLAQIADYSPSEVADAIDSVRAQIKDALAATDSRGKPDGASVPDQSCATCGGSGDRNGNRRAADPFGTCPGCGGTGVAAADREAPDEEEVR